MFHKILSKQTKQRETSSHAAGIILDLNSPDREEDGFVLVGESLYERDIIHARDFHNNLQYHSDNPPAYSSVVGVILRFILTKVRHNRLSAWERAISELSKVLDTKQGFVLPKMALAIVPLPILDIHFLCEIHLPLH